MSRDPAKAVSDPPTQAGPWQWAADLGRQQMAVAAEAASTVFGGAQAMRSIQQEALQEASERRAEAWRRLGTAAAPEDWAALQSEWLRGEFDGAARYWQRLAAAALEMNTALLGCGVHLVDTEDAFAPFSARFLHS